MILVDTSVWSIALRRRRADLNPEERIFAFALRDLVIAGEAVMIGPVRQEVLSGISSHASFRIVQQQLTSISNLPLDIAVWERAADFFNTCRAQGIAPDAIDMTICAAAHQHATPILTTDPDFRRYAKHLPSTLHQL